MLSHAMDFLASFGPLFVRHATFLFTKKLRQPSYLKYHSIYLLIYSILFQILPKAGVLSQEKSKILCTRLNLKQSLRAHVASGHVTWGSRLVYAETRLHNVIT